MTQTPGYNQNPYDSSYADTQAPPPDYGNPQYAPAPNPGYAPPPDYGNQQYAPAPDPVYGIPPYNAGYAPVGPPPTPVKTTKSPVLGIIGLVSVVLCAVIGGVLWNNLCVAIYDVYGASVFTGGTNVIDPYSLPPAAVSALTGTMLGIIIVSVVALVGWILSIVATATKRGRIFGVFGLILGIVLPFVSIFVATALFLANYGLV